MITQTGWTLDEFDRQPFPFILELVDYWNPKKKKKKVRSDYENKAMASAAGVLPNALNMAAEKNLPPWVQEARAKLREDAAKQKAK